VTFFYVTVMKHAGKQEADVVVIGSGIAGLCCAGLLARYGQDVLVLESHDLPGGAAHSFEIKGYKFDSGPSLFSGFQSRGPQANPLAQVIFFFFILLLM
jgi:phytoene dehydrogenase-like protein